MITEGKDHPSVYNLVYFKDGKWYPILAEQKVQGRIKIFKFKTVIGQKVRLNMKPKNGKVVLAEVGIYHERV
ncbi:hypothetical protein OKW96_10570 [Sphingobacterium sp. KU25419]|nr:hypothetical protein OKW96_10570 [Sphingobacterium sp. KU25419]